MPIKNYRKFVDLLPFNISVEALIVSLINESKGSISIDDFEIKPIGKHGQLQEVKLISETYSSSRNKDQLQIELKRNGIFDLLPVNLFLHKASEEDIKKEDYQDQVREARKFFLPFDQVIGNAKLEIALREDRKARYLLSSLQEFWALPNYLDLKQLQILYYLLPRAIEIVGDKQLTTLSLEALLLHSVEIVLVNSPVYAMDEDAVPTLGDATLGVDMVIGHAFSDGISGWQVQIKEIHAEDLDTFLYGGKMLKLIEEVFIPHFIPMEIDIQVKLEVLAHEKDFSLGDSENFSILGYTTNL